MTGAKVSVIIPVYNTAPYLRRCLDSVCGQTLRNIEIICVNDGSSDNSPGILQEYATGDERVKIIDFSENRGASAARNAGIDAARGEYIGFVDSDDCVDLDFYEKLYRNACKRKAYVVKGEIKQLDKFGNDITQDLYKLSEKIQHNKAYFYCAFTSAIYKVSLIRKHNILFPEGISQFEDPFFSIQVTCFIDKIEIVKDVFYYYIQRNESEVNTSITLIKIKQILYSIDKIVELLNRNYITKYHYIIQYRFIIGILWGIMLKIDNKYYKHIIKALGNLYNRCMYADICFHNYTNKLILIGIIINKKIKAVSFDIFDTIILRNCLKPYDLFFLMNIYFKEHIIDDANINFASVRIKSEEYLVKNIGVENVTLDIIYDEIGKRLNLSLDQVINLKELEIQLEYDISECNYTMVELINMARKLKKKVILCSDMYLPSKVIKNICSKHKIVYEKLYVSSDYGKRKDTGKLFELILETEKLFPYELLHIGDNKNADFLIPLTKGIYAFHYTSYATIEKNKILHSNNTFILGHLINRENNYLSSLQNKKFSSLYEFGFYCIGPIILSFILKILNDKEIQQNYDVIFFSSRDGYIPYKLYESLRSIFPHTIPGRYLYTSRISLYISNYNGDVLEYISQFSKRKDHQKYEIKQIFKTLGIEKFYSYFNMNKDNNIEHCISNISEASKFLEKRKENAKKYFKQEFNTFAKIIIFDCGYSGSIAENIFKLIKNNVDKIYIYETDKNKNKDKYYNTKTFILDNERLTLPFHLMFEEIFSPPEPTVIGYEKKLNKYCPILDASEIITESTCHDLLSVHKGIYDYVHSFCESFATNMHKANFNSCKDILRYTLEPMLDIQDQSLNLLKNIIFEDNYYNSSPRLPLLDKITKNYNVFKGNILFDKNFIQLDGRERLQNNSLLSCKIGIHIHMHYIDMYKTFIQKLLTFPNKFDLYITITNNIYYEFLMDVFSSTYIKNLNKFFVFITPNRGRDIAPWLIDIGQYSLQYEIFGHFHTKKSEGRDYGSDWHTYLCDNLLDADSVRDIIRYFCRDKYVGLVYPPIFSKIFDIYNNVKHFPVQEEFLINKFLNKLNIPEIDNKNDILFSVGTMFWYRPIALIKLLNADLSYNDFPEEPIGNNGTLAHAIERLPSYIADIEGFHTKLFLSSRTLIDNFYKNVYERTEKYQNIQSIDSTRKLLSNKLRYNVMKDFHKK